MSNNLVEIKEYINIQVNVTSMEILITAYVTRIRVIYNLLLLH